MTPQRWVYLICPVCGKEFPYSATQYRHEEKYGKKHRESCCKSCALTLWHRRKREGAPA